MSFSVESIIEQLSCFMLVPNHADLFSLAIFNTFVFNVWYSSSSLVVFLNLCLMIV